MRLSRDPKSKPYKNHYPEILGSNVLAPGSKILVKNSIFEIKTL